jgi:hypothetical protein
MLSIHTSTEPRIGPLHTILPVPAEVEKFVRKSVGDDCPPDMLQEALNEYTLAYHFHLVSVVARMNGKGVEVLACNGGIRDYYQSAPPEEVREVVYMVPDLWW